MLISVVWIVCRTAGHLSYISETTLVLFQSCLWTRWRQTIHPISIWSYGKVISCTISQTHDGHFQCICFITRLSSVLTWRNAAPSVEGFYFHHKCAANHAGNHHGGPLENYYSWFKILSQCVSSWNAHLLAAFLPIRIYKGFFGYKVFRYSTSCKSGESISEKLDFWAKKGMEMLEMWRKLIEIQIKIVMQTDLANNYILHEA